MMRLTWTPLVPDLDPLLNNPQYKSNRPVQQTKQQQKEKEKKIHIKTDGKQSDLLSTWTGLF